MQESILLTLPFFICFTIVVINYTFNFLFTCKKKILLYLFIQNYIKNNNKKIVLAKFEKHKYFSKLLASRVVKVFIA